MAMIFTVFYYIIFVAKSKEEEFGKMYKKDENIRMRQSYVSKEGTKYENFVIQLLQSDNYIRANAVIGKGTKGENTEKILLEEGISVDTELLKIKYNSNNISRSFLLDNDIVVYSKPKRAIVCVISVKKSFRERGGETAYWMVKKKESNKPYKYILVTPDNDNELFKPHEPQKRNKWRSILTAEMDGVFVVKEGNENIEYEEPFFKVGKRHLIRFVKAQI